MTISKRLQEERKLRKLTQTALAEAGDVGVSTQKNYEAERSDSVPDATYLAKVAHLVDVQYIVTGDRSVAYGVSDAVTTYETSTGKKAPARAEEAMKIAVKLINKLEIPEDSIADLCRFIYKCEGATYDLMYDVLYQVGFKKRTKPL